MPDNINIKKGFTQIDTKWIFDQNLSDGAFRTLATLKSYQYGGGKIFPAQKTMAEERGKTKTTIINQLNELTNKKYIEKKRRGYSKSNEYTIINQNNLTNGLGNIQKGNTSINQKSYYQKSSIFEPNNKTNNINLINGNNPLRGQQLESVKEIIYKKYSWLKKKKPS